MMASPIQDIYTCNTNFW